MAACPPLLAAKGHWVRRDRSTNTETCAAWDGLKTHQGLTAAWFADQYDPTKLLYAVSFLVSTAPSP